MLLRFVKNYDILLPFSAKKTRCAIAPEVEENGEYN